MKYYKTETNRVNKVICDRCGKEFRPGHMDRNHTAFNTSLKIVKTWHDWAQLHATERKTYEADICPDCWVRVVIPTLQKAGITFYTTTEEL